MATRRKYKTRQYRDGGRVLADETIEPDAAPEPVRSSPAASPPADDGNPLLHALRAQQRAELLQRQAMQQPQQPQTVAELIDALPVSEHKKQFLRQHPEMLQPERVEVMRRHHSAALQAGIPDDSEAMDSYLRSNVAREIEALQRPAPQPAPAAQRQPEPVPAQHRRSIPMSAPVSRAVPAGGRQPDGWNHLTAAEVQVAHHSFSAPGMSNVEKEKLYLANKCKYLGMRADGSYSDQGGRWMSELVPISTIRCDDEKVREFILAELLNFNPYRQHPTAHELHALAKRRFGLVRCLTLEYWLH